MTHETWIIQKARLIDRFGERNFSKEFSLLVAIECRPMPDADFVAMVNAMIGGRKPTDPPLIRDFRDARLAWEKRKFERDLNGAARILAHPTLKRPLSEILNKDFGAVDGVKDALEIARLRLRTSRDHDDDGGAA